MQSPVLCARDFIKDKDSFSEYQCGICYDICVRPSQCKGSCKKIFCMKCVSEWRIERDSCPLRCSSPFYVDVKSELQIQFSCPYGAEKCPTPISSLQEFNSHYKICKYAPPEELQRQRLKKQFRCPSGHSLEFFIGSYEEMCNSNCNICHCKKLCRAICRKCENKLYCVECRPPPCKKEHCPIGHKMKLSSCSNLAYICDICGISTAISNCGVFDDSLCNFGICEECHDKIVLKQSGGETAIEISTNQHDQCSLKHKLQSNEQENVYVECSNCAKKKYCPKACPECKETYCLNCKPILIQGDETCESGHQFIQLSAHEILNAPQEKLVCMKCEKEGTSMKYDKICKILLCENCLVYGCMLAAEKERFIENVTCKNGHVLRYLNNPEAQKGKCTLCLRMTPAKLFCDFCDRGSQCYCCCCKPLNKFATCYFGHKLTKVEESSKVQSCALCDIKEKNMVGCVKCSFYICESCQFQYDSQNVLPEEQSWMIDESESQFQAQ